MKIYSYEYKTALPTSPCVLCLGFFDGVTAAHRELIQKAKEIADKEGLKLGVFTFPAENKIKPDVERIYSTEEKLVLLSRLGVDFVVLGDFGALSGLLPSEFVRNVIVRDIGAKVAASGFNFHFGRGASGDASELLSLMRSEGGDAVILKELCLDGITVSSTAIRDALSKTDIERANELLGAPYFIRAEVKSGIGEGKKLGFPTVNTEFPKGRISPRGVFRSVAVIGDKIYHAVTNIGSCPTLGEREIHAETHIIDYSGDLYGKEVEIYILGFLRDEAQFDSIDQLKRQVEEDKERAKRENGELKWQKLGLK